MALNEIQVPNIGGLNALWPQPNYSGPRPSCPLSRPINVLSDYMIIGIEIKKQTIIMAKRAKFTYHDNPRWRRPPY